MCVCVCVCVCGSPLNVKREMERKEAGKKVKRWQ